jgi:hypothetical protein
MSNVIFGEMGVTELMSLTDFQDFDFLNAAKMQCLFKTRKEKKRKEKKRKEKKRKEKKRKEKKRKVHAGTSGPQSFVHGNGIFRAEVKETCTVLPSSASFVNFVQNQALEYDGIGIGEIVGAEHGYILPTESPLHELRGPMLTSTPKFHKQCLSLRFFMVKKIFSHTKLQT